MLCSFYVIQFVAYKSMQSYYNIICIFSVTTYRYGLPQDFFGPHQFCNKKYWFILCSLPLHCSIPQLMLGCCVHLFTVSRKQELQFFRFIISLNENTKTRIFKRSKLDRKLSYDNREHHNFHCKNTCLGVVQIYFMLMVCWKSGNCFIF